jgi:nitronate monooxygenase
MRHPAIIQGGMGVAVSNWRLARAVARLGELGVISGTMLAVILARRLAEGDPSGDMRRALAAFPMAEIAERVLDAHFIAGGKAPDATFRPVAMPSVELSPTLAELITVANFVEVYLAKEGHEGPVGINLLEKVQIATLPSLYGAMLAGVDYVLMGAGIPRAIPGALDRFAAGQPAELKVDFEGASDGEALTSRFDPQQLWRAEPRPLRRPQFLAIVSSATLALTLAKKSNGRVDGFVVEGDVAGGHNAPPRGPMQLDAEGQPIYGARDVPDLAKIRDLGLPFWLAGGQATPEKLAAARALGAAGIQVGTAFAFCEESGITTELKRDAIAASQAGAARVFTDPSASPTGFPFKILQLRNTLSEPADYAGRERVCDLGYLRQAYRKDDGTAGYRCAAEPIDDYVRKGGAASDATGRKCLCNGLIATVGLGQRRNGGSELPLVTAGNEVADLARLLRPGGGTHTAEDVVRYLRGTAAATSATGGGAVAVGGARE